MWSKIQIYEHVIVSLLLSRHISMSLTNLTKVRPLFSLSHRGSDNSPLLVVFNAYYSRNLYSTSWYFVWSMLSDWLKSWRNMQSSYKVQLNTTSYGELSDPLCNSVNIGLTLVSLVNNRPTHASSNMQLCWLIIRVLAMNLVNLMMKCYPGMHTLKFEFDPV